jgi:hypothetical protein
MKEKIGLLFIKLLFRQKQTVSTPYAGFDKCTQMLAIKPNPISLSFTPAGQRSWVT